MSSTILNDIVRDYESITTAWFTSLFPIAQAVFWTLVLIELTWSAVWWVVDREDGLSVVAALLRKVLAVGFFYALDRKSTRLNSSHGSISYAVFCLKKKNQDPPPAGRRDASRAQPWHAGRAALHAH